MKTSILQGSVFDVLPTLEAGSVDCCVTSPPYWQLRSYLPKGHALKPLELGSEKTPAEFVQNIVRVFQEVRRVLAEHGTVWLNIGDTYASNGGATRQGPGSIAQDDPAYRRWEMQGRPAEGNLCLIPQRLAIALQDDGWIIRSVIVWHKPAPMPSSVSGWAWRRCRVKTGKTPGREVKAGVNGHRSVASLKDERSEAGKALSAEDRAEWRDCPGCAKCMPYDGYVLRRGSWRPTNSWEPILMLAKSDRYFCDGEAVKQPAATATISRDQYTRVLDDPDEQFAVRHDHETISDGGANLRDVWTIAAEPLKEAHYAAFPSELVYRCLKAGTSAKGYCPECGAPWVRVVEKESVGCFHAHEADGEQYGTRQNGQGPMSGSEYAASGLQAKTIGWRPSCSHISEPRAGVVLDPFSGSGRTGLEARRLGLDYIGIELNPAYVEMSQRILRDDAPLFV